jgi:hypothetical protein
VSTTLQDRVTVGDDVGDAAVAEVQTSEAPSIFLQTS